MCFVMTHQKWLALLIMTYTVKFYTVSDSGPWIVKSDQRLYGHEGETIGLVWRPQIDTQVIQRLEIHLKYAPSDDLDNFHTVFHTGEDVHVDDSKELTIFKRSIFYRRITASFKNQEITVELSDSKFEDTGLFELTITAKSQLDDKNGILTSFLATNFIFIGYKYKPIITAKDLQCDISGEATFDFAVRDPTTDVLPSNVSITITHETEKDITYIITTHVVNSTVEQPVDLILFNNSRYDNRTKITYNKGSIKFAMSNCSSDDRGRIVILLKLGLGVSGQQTVLDSLHLYFGELTSQTGQNYDSGNSSVEWYKNGFIVLCAITFLLVLVIIVFSRYIVILKHKLEKKNRQGDKLIEMKSVGCSVSENSLQEERRNDACPDPSEARPEDHDAERDVLLRSSPSGTSAANCSEK